MGPDQTITNFVILNKHVIVTPRLALFLIYKSVKNIHKTWVFWLFWVGLTEKHTKYRIAAVRFGSVRPKSVPVQSNSGSSQFRFRPVQCHSGSHRFRFKPVPVRTDSGSNRFRFRPIPVQISSGSESYSGGPGGGQGGNNFICFIAFQI